jgi:hypothetical protein
VTSMRPRPAATSRGPSAAASGGMCALSALPPMAIALGTFAIWILVMHISAWVTWHTWTPFVLDGVWLSHLGQLAALLYGIGLVVSIGGWVRRRHGLGVAARAYVLALQTGAPARAWRDAKAHYDRDDAGPRDASAGCAALPSVPGRPAE